MGCKWSLGVLGLVRSGVCRPGAMAHALPGLSKKVLNERLRKLVRFALQNEIDAAQRGRPRGLRGARAASRS